MWKASYIIITVEGLPSFDQQIVLIGFSLQRIYGSEAVVFGERRGISRVRRGEIHLLNAWGNVSIVEKWSGA